MAVPNSYPDRNPFPLQATASVETTGRTSGSFASVQTPQLRIAWEQVRAYLHADQHPGSDRGVFALYGAAGTGKTHTLRELLQRVRTTTAEENRSCGVAYVLSGGPDLNGIRYGVLKQISPDTLASVSRAFVSVIGREHVDATEPPQTESGLRQRERLRENLPQIGDLIRAALIDPAAIGRQQEAELGEAGDDDIRSVLSYIDDADLGKTAFTWLCGEEIDKDTLLRLGVRNNRAADHSHRVLRVVLRLFQRTKTPLVVVIDQCENFLRPDPSKPVLNDSVLFLQNLIELLPKEQACLGVAMNIDTWKALPDYVRQRFGANALQFSVLSLSAAREFIHTYKYQESPTNADAADIAPFDEHAIKEILSSVRGNLRGFLQLCYESFKLAAPRRAEITPEIVRQALARAREPRPTLAGVAQQIDVVLRERSLDLAANTAALPPTAGAARSSYLITSRSGSPVAWLEVSESVFIDDEASQSITIIEAVRRAREDPRRLPVIVVIVGYVSPEIQTRLMEATPHVLVYEREYLGPRLSDVLGRLQAVPSTGITAADLERVRDELLQVLQVRTDEARRITSGADGVLQKEEQTRIDQIWRDARANWVKERKQIEDQIKMARKGRREEELAALESERSRAERERALRSFLLWGFIALSIETYLVYWLGGWQSVRFALPEVLTKYLNVLVLPLVPITVLAWLQIYGLPGPMRALWSKVRSLDELDNVAAQFARKRTATRAHMRSNNPQLRYAAVCSVRMIDRTPKKNAPGWMPRPYGLAPITPADVFNASFSESNATVRRAMAQRGLIDQARAVKLRQIVYQYTGNNVYDLLEPVLNPASEQVLDAVRRIPALGDAFNRGIRPENWAEMIDAASVPNIQSVLRDLSPLEYPGVGTCDYLDLISEIDNLYLFFRQWLFFVELDVPAVYAVRPASN